MATAAFISLGSPERNVLGALVTRSVPLIQEHAEGLGLSVTYEQAVEVWKRAVTHLNEQLEEEITFAIERLC